MHNCAQATVFNWSSCSYLCACHAVCLACSIHVRRVVQALHVIRQHGIETDVQESLLDKYISSFRTVLSSTSQNVGTPSLNQPPYTIRTSFSILNTGKDRFVLVLVIALLFNQSSLTMFRRLTVWCWCAHTGAWDVGTNSSTFIVNRPT